MDYLRSGLTLLSYNPTRHNDNTLLSQRFDKLRACLRQSFLVETLA